MGKAKKERTELLEARTKDELFMEYRKNQIEQHNFNRLIACGVIIEAANGTT